MEATPTHLAAIRQAIIGLDMAGFLPDDERMRRLYDESRDALRVVARDASDRITRAIAALDACPDVDPAKATRAQTSEAFTANLAAWTITTEGRDPPSRRGSRKGER